jgi:hypothetical protein
MNPNDEAPDNCRYERADCSHNDVLPKGALSITATPSAACAEARQHQ